VPIQLPTPKPHVRFGGWSGPTLTAATVALAGASTTCTLVWTLPAPLVLPALGVLATLAAALIALIAWVSAERMGGALTYWDVVGALTFVGIFASLLSEPELALLLLENQRTD
jgi:hypothetical protein